MIGLDADTLREYPAYQGIHPYQHGPLSTLARLYSLCAPMFRFVSGALAIFNSVLAFAGGYRRGPIALCPFTARRTC